MATNKERFASEKDTGIISTRTGHFHPGAVLAAGQRPGGAGLQASFNTNRKWNQIRDEVRSGRPVIVSGKYTASGHIIVIVGLRGEDFIVHDPWGNALREYRQRNGRWLLYPYPYMHAKTRALKSAGKWAHFIRT